MLVQLWKRLLPAGRLALQPTLKPNAPEGSPNTEGSISCSCIQTPRGTFSQLSAENTVLLVSTCSDRVAAQSQLCFTESGGGKLTWCLFKRAGSERTSCGVFIRRGRLPGFQSKSVNWESTLRDTNSLFKRPSASSSLSLLTNCDFLLFSSCRTSLLVFLLLHQIKRWT